MTDLQALAQPALVVILSYLLGSIPTAYLIAKQKGINIFEVGSGNMGATNVARSLGFWWGILIFLLDGCKGMAAIALSIRLWPENPAGATVIAAVAAIVGHNWSFFATALTGKIRGGKGAATWFGTMLVLAPSQVIIGMALIGLLVILLTRYVSLAVILMTLASMSWLTVLVSQQVLPGVYVLYALLVTVLILYRFRENIQRLVTGTERRLGEKT